MSPTRALPGGADGAYFLQTLDLAAFVARLQQP